MGMKYIVLKINNGETVREWPVIFPDMMVHKQMYESMKFQLMRFHDQECSVIAAGSFSCFGGEVRCFGESETLGIESRGEEDAKLIKMFDYLHGIV